MKKDDEQKIKANLFGTVGKVPCTGNHQPNIEELTKPFEWERGIMHFFCEGCGFTREISKELAEDCAILARKELPIELNNYYFHVKTCTLCWHTKTGVELRLIPKQ